MLCALTVRRLKPGTFEDFRSAWEAGPPPEGWTEAYTVRGLDDENEIVSFGFFDGTIDELRASQEEGKYDEERAKTDEFVESVGTDGIFEVVVHMEA